jgi:quinol monooxygenase YgiN
MSSVSVVAKLVANEGAADLVKAELLKLIVPTRLEEGCIEYHLHQDNDDPSVFIFYENWESLACLERHLDSPHYGNYVAAVEGCIVEKVVHKMTCVA